MSAEFSYQDGQAALFKEVLQLVGFTTNFSPEDEDTFIRLLRPERRPIATGDVLCEQDEIAEDMWILVEGTTMGRRKVGNRQLTILPRTANRGLTAHLQGEMAYIRDDRRRQLSIQASTLGTRFVFSYINFAKAVCAVMREGINSPVPPAPILQNFLKIVQSKSDAMLLNGDVRIAVEEDLHLLKTIKERVLSREAIRALENPHFAETQEARAVVLHIHMQFSDNWSRNDLELKHPEDLRNAYSYVFDFLMKHDSSNLACTIDPPSADGEIRVWWRVPAASLTNKDGRPSGIEWERLIDHIVDECRTLSAGFKIDLPTGDAQDRLWLCLELCNGFTGDIGSKHRSAFRFVSYAADEAQLVARAACNDDGAKNSDALLICETLRTELKVRGRSLDGPYQMRAGQRQLPVVTGEFTTQYRTIPVYFLSRDKRDSKHQ